MEGMPGSRSGAERVARRPSPLVRFNTALAQPLASLFLVLGFAPGQLSIQSFTFTLVGLLRMADGKWAHMATGAGIVYVAMLLDRADHIISQRKGRPAMWTVFLGLAVDRLVEVALLVGLGILTVQGMTDSPFPHYAVLKDTWILVLATATAGLMMSVKALGAYSEVLLLRLHLLTTRRLPGPSAIPRFPPALAVIEPFAGRDETILIWCLGVVFGQLDLTLIILVALQLLLVFERLVLFRLRLRDPEPEASRLLGPDYP